MFYWLNPKIKYSNKNVKKVLNIILVCTVNLQSCLGYNIFLNKVKLVNKHALSRLLQNLKFLNSEF